MTSTTAKPFAVLTGASNGIGFELGKLFAQHGFDLVVAADDTRINHAMREFMKWGAAVDTVQTDLTHWNGVETLYRAIVATERRVDLLALNAGVDSDGFARGSNPRQQIDQINRNLGIVRLAKLVVPDMVAHNCGRILLTSPLVAPATASSVDAFAVSKAYQQTFANSLRSYLHNTPITVTALQMGSTDSEVVRRNGEDDRGVGAGMQVDLAEVARQSYEALLAGKAQVIAGSTTPKPRIRPDHGETHFAAGT